MTAPIKTKVSYSDRMPGDLNNSPVKLITLVYSDGTESTTRHYCTISEWEDGTEEEWID